MRALFAAMRPRLEPSPVVAEFLRTVREAQVSPLPCAPRSACSSAPLSTSSRTGRGTASNSPPAKASGAGKSLWSALWASWPTGSCSATAPPRRPAYASACPRTTSTAAERGRTGRGTRGGFRPDVRPRAHRGWTAALGRTLRFSRRGNRRAGPLGTSSPAHSHARRRPASAGRGSGPAARPAYAGPGRSLDYLVGAAEQRCRDGDAETAGRPQVD